MDITIVIVSFNSGEILERCLKTIDNKRFPTLVIENSNNENLKNYIENKYANVSFLLSRENLGYGKANNLGINKAKTKHVLILNPDTQLQDDTVDNLIHCANQNPDFALIAPEIISQDIKVDTTRNDQNDNGDFKEVSIIKGFAFLLNKEVLKEVGLFDENFFLYFEEIDLCRRVIKNKRKIFLSRNSKVYHKGGSSHVKEINNEMELSRNWHYMWSKFYYHKKHYGFLYSIAKILPSFVSSIIKFLFFSCIFHKEKKNIYFHRMSGIYNSILGKNSWYRPKIKTSY